MVAADNIYLERNKASLKAQSRQFPSAFFIAVLCLISVLWRKEINPEYHRRNEVQIVASAPKFFSPLDERKCISWRAWSFKKCLTALIRAVDCCKNKLGLDPLRMFYFCQLAPSGLHINKKKCQENGTGQESSYSETSRKLLQLFWGFVFGWFWFFFLLAWKNSIAEGIRRTKLEAMFSNRDANKFKIRCKINNEKKKNLAKPFGRVCGRRWEGKSQS